MDKKELLFVAHHLTIGGVQKSLINALNAIDYEEYNVTLYLRRNRTELLQNINKNVDVIINEDRTHYYRKPYAFLLEALIRLLKMTGSGRAADACQKKQTDYIVKKQMEHERRSCFSGVTYDIAVSYVQGYEAKFVAEYVDAARKIVFYHAGTDELHKLHETCFGCFDRIVGVNESVRDLLLALYPAYGDRITYLTNYVDAEEIYRKSSAFSVQTPKTGSVLCTCGRFAKVKGFDIAVEAAAMLHERGCRFLWFFLGDGPEKQRLEELIRRYGLQENIVITGMQENPYPWIRACDIYVQPSREEAHSLTIVEAQILCRPVVTTATVGGRRLVRDGVNGAVCGVSAESLAEAIMKLLNGSGRREGMTAVLECVDRSEELAHYREGWSRLLEGEPRL